MVHVFSLYGDSGIGKHTLVHSLKNHIFPEGPLDTSSQVNLPAGSRFSFVTETKSSIFENQIFIAQSEHTYFSGNIFYLCFSLADPNSLEHVYSTWYPLISFINNDQPIILVGLQADQPISDTLYQRAIEIAAKINAQQYIETSVLSNINLDKIFTTDFPKINPIVQREESNNSSQNLLQIYRFNETEPIYEKKEFIIQQSQKLVEKKKELIRQANVEKVNAYVKQSIKSESNPNNNHNHKKQKIDQFDAYRSSIFYQLKLFNPTASDEQIESMISQMEKYYQQMSMCPVQYPMYCGMPFFQIC